MEETPGSGHEIVDLDSRRCRKRREEFMRAAAAEGAEVRDLLGDALSLFHQSAGPERQMIAFALHDLLKELDPSSRERLRRIVGHCSQG